MSKEAKDLAENKHPVFDTSFEDEGIQTTDAEYYKAEKGRTDRIWIPTLSVAMAFVHFVEDGGLGYILSDGEYEKDARGVYKCTKMGEIDKLVGEEGKPRFGLNIVQYSTKRDGSLAKPFGYTVKVALWRSQHFVQIRTTHVAFKKLGGVESIDFNITCDNTDYQRLTLQGLPECIVREISEKQKKEDPEADESKFLSAQIKAEALHPGWDVKKMLGKKKTLSEVAAALRKGASDTTSTGKDSGGETISNEDLDDVINSLKSPS